jgi:hypothetical protein
MVTNMPARLDDLRKDLLALTSPPNLDNLTPQIIGTYNLDNIVTSLIAKDNPTTYHLTCTDNTTGKTFIIIYKDKNKAIQAFRAAIIYETPEETPEETP